MDVIQTDKMPRRAGKHCAISHSHIENMILKIFLKPVSSFSEVNTFRWGDLPREGTKNPNMSVPLIDATKIQNFMWLEGLAPRVYDIVGIEIDDEKYLAQYTEFVPGKHAKTYDDFYSVYKKVKDLGEIYGFKNEKDDCAPYDVIQGKLVDFNTFHLTGDHKEKIANLYREYGLYGKRVYHPEFGLTGPRQNDKRVEWMKLKDIDFEEKTVMDLGCAGGYFCRYAHDRGALKVVGYDHPGHGSKDPVKGAYISSIELEYWDVDFVDLELPNKPAIGADIVFFLSMNFHIGIPEWLVDYTMEVCIFEDNSKERDALPTLEKMFKKVVRVGTAEDHGDKPIYHCFV